MRYWLMKSEPAAFSLDDLERAGREHWDGIRNYQARNYMRDDMHVGDRVLFYHSSTDAPGVVGTAQVVREAYPDHTSWDPDSKYFDPKSSPENPRWVMVELAFESRLPAPVPLAAMREEPALADMLLLRKGQRLSILPVTGPEFAAVLALAGRLAEGG